MLATIRMVPLVTASSPVLALCWVLEQECTPAQLPDGSQGNTPAQLPDGSHAPLCSGASTTPSECIVLCC